jgi:hypothetical protein
MILCGNYYHPVADLLRVFRPARPIRLPPRHIPLAPAGRDIQTGVVLAHALKPLHRPPGLEALLLVVLVTVLGFAGFEIVRRAPVLRPLFGLGPRPRIATPATAGTATTAAQAGTGPA